LGVVTKEYVPSPDVFVAKLNASGSVTLYSTYLEEMTRMRPEA
jgi:hypothetical protein